MKKKFHVLIVSHDKNSPGGVANFISILFDHLSDQYIYEHFSIGNELGKKLNFIKPLIVIIDVIRLAWKCLNTSVDCVHLNPSLNAKSLLRDGLFLITLSIMNVKTVVFFHGWGVKEAEVIKNDPFLRRLFKWVFGKATVIIVLASTFRKFLVEMGFDSNRIRVFSTMFEGKYFQNVVPAPRQNGRTILFLSRFVRAKGIYEVVEAFALIANKFQDVRLILAGDGPEQGNIRNRIEELGLSNRVSLPGYLRGYEKTRVLMAADLFVFPTYYGEGCPLSLLEAMAAGTAVITTSVGGIPDVFADGRNGILLKQVDAVSVAGAIEKLLNDNQLLTMAKEANKQDAWAKYEAGVVTRKIEDVYADALPKIH